MVGKSNQAVDKVVARCLASGDVSQATVRAMLKAADWPCTVRNVKRRVNNLIEASRAQRDKFLKGNAADVPMKKKPRLSAAATRRLARKPVSAAAVVSTLTRHRDRNLTLIAPEETVEPVETAGTRSTRTQAAAKRARALNDKKKGDDAFIEARMRWKSEKGKPKRPSHGVGISGYRKSCEDICTEVGVEYGVHAPSYHKVLRYEREKVPLNTIKKRGPDPKYSKILIEAAHLHHRLKQARAGKLSQKSTAETTKAVFEARELAGKPGKANPRVLANRMARDHADVFKPGAKRCVDSGRSDWVRLPPSLPRGCAACLPAARCHAN